MAEILSGAIDVYTNTVQIYTIINQPNKALEYVERSKVRNPIDLLASQDMYPKRELYTEPSIHQSCVWVHARTHTLYQRHVHSLVNDRLLLVSTPVGDDDTKTA